MDCALTPSVCCPPTLQTAAVPPPLCAHACQAMVSAPLPPMPASCWGPDLPSKPQVHHELMQPRRPGQVEVASLRGPGLTPQHSSEADALYRPAQATQPRCTRHCMSAGLQNPCCGRCMTLGCPSDRARLTRHSMAVACLYVSACFPLALKRGGMVTLALRPHCRIVRSSSSMNWPARRSS